MRRILKKITLLSAALLLLGIPVLADEGMMDKTLQQEEQNGKDVCLLVAKNCGNEVDTIQERIERLRKEISRGTDVYNNEELNRLKRELDSEIKSLENITTGG